jgi:hypothetical protein
VSAAKSAGGGVVLGGILVIVIILLGVFLGGYKGQEEPVPCTSADWRAYAPQCNRWSPSPKPPVIMPQKTGKK